MVRNPSIFIFHHTHPTHHLNTPTTRSCLACHARELTGSSLPDLPARLGSLCSPFPLTPVPCKGPLLWPNAVAARAEHPRHRHITTAVRASGIASNQRLLWKPAICSLRLAQPGDAWRESQCLPRHQKNRRLRHSNARLRARRKALPRLPTSSQTLTYKISLQSRES